MKLERRGKYPGVKVHLEKDECEEILKVMNGGEVVPGEEFITYNFYHKLGKQINKLIQSEPDLLIDRTPEQVKEVVELEFITAQKKLEALQQGKKWDHLTKQNQKEGLI